MPALTFLALACVGGAIYLARDTHADAGNVRAGAIVLGLLVAPMVIAVLAVFRLA